MIHSNTLGSVQRPLQSLLQHLLREGANQNNTDQRAVIGLLETTIQEILAADAMDAARVLTAIIQVVRFALDPVPLEDKLQKALDSLMSVSDKERDSGCLFLVDHDTHRLRRVAHTNIPRTVLEACNHLGDGQCLCGQAMTVDTTQTFIPTHTGTHEHDITRPETMQPHGHTILNIKAMDSDRTLMVINLYANGHHTEEPRSKLFLDAMTMTFAVLHTLHTASEYMYKHAFKDPLTGLSNYRLLQNRLEQAVHKTRRSGEVFAVMSLGLDQFSRINDTMGRATGDLILKTLANKLVDVVRASDTVAKADGDEFLLLLFCRTIRELMPLVQKIKRVAVTPMRVDNQDIRISYSMGISLFPNDQEQLLEKSRFAMQHAKRQGRGQFQLFSNEAHNKTRQIMELEENLRTAIENGEIVVNYQAKISLATMRIIGFEALVRWPDPDNPGHAKAFPDQFIPLAEETGLILPLGRQVLATACQDLKMWLNMGYDRLGMAVNLSARQFSDAGLSGDIIKALKQSGLDPHFLELEITESYVMDDATKAKETLASLKTLGVKVSLDDFGTGYSSLSNLRRLPFDRLKIDRSFITELSTSRDDLGIVQAILQMARSLRLQVTAEGVETEEQQRTLQGVGCDEVQGWLHSKAISAEEVPALLEKYNGHCGPPQ